MTTVRLKLKRVFLLILGSLFAFSVLGIGFSMPELAGRYIAWRINHDSQGKVRLVEPMLLPGPGLSVKEVNLSDWGKPPISLSLTNITMQRTISKGVIKGLPQNKTNYLPEAILERDKERRSWRSHCTTQAMSDAVVAQKRLGPSGSSIFGLLRRCSSAMCHRGHRAFVAPCTNLKSGTSNSQFYSAATPKEPFLVAVTGKGQFGSGESRPLRLTGRVKGDFTSGIYQVSGLRVKIDKVGEINLSGQIETKGQYGKLSVNLAKISLSELKKSINLPDMPTEGLMDGQVYFTLRHNKDQWQAQSVDYCLSFQNLSFPQQQIPPLSGEVKGYYDFFAESGRLNQARIFTQTGGEISLFGTMGKKGFDFSFETKGLYLEDLLEALPKPIREKIGVRAATPKT